MKAILMKIRDWGQENYKRGKEINKAYVIYSNFLKP